MTATLANGRARLSAGPFNWDADLPLALGGENLAPSPTAYLLGALAGCGVAFLHDTLAPQFDVTIDGHHRRRALLRRRPRACSASTAPPRTSPTSSSTSAVTSPSPDDRVEAMLAAWRERCPIYLALLKPQSIALSTSTSGDGG